MMIFAGCALVTLTVALCSFFPLWRHESWWVRSMDFPRLQIFCLCIAMITVELIFLPLEQIESWGLVLIGAICLTYQFIWIFPYTPLANVEVATAPHPERKPSIRVLTANVLATNRQASKLLELIEQYVPDIVVTLESNQWWQEQLDVLEHHYPHTIKCPQDNLYGMHVYSKFALIDSVVEYLVEEDVPSIHTLVCLPSGERICLHCLHPAPPSPTQNETSNERDVELIIVAKSVAETKIPVIVTGDLNDVAWSATTRLFRKISGLLDPRIGRGMFNTFHTRWWFVRWPLDHLFHSHHFSLGEIRRLPAYGSDHFALLTYLVLHPQNSTSHAMPDADKDDHRWAQRKADSHPATKEDVPKPSCTQS